jgi:hypothetical protein
MTIRRVLLILLVCAMCGASRARAVTPLFLLDTEVGSPAILFRVNPTTGALTTLGTLPAGIGEAAGLAAANGNRLYVTTIQTTVTSLFEVTVSPFGFRELGTLAGAFQGLAYSAGEGQLYAIEEDTDRFYRITLEPVVLTLIGTVRVGSTGGPVLDILGGDLAQDGAGNWYLWTNSTSDLYLLNPATAVATQVDPQGAGPKTGIAFNYQAGGTLYGSSRVDDALETINPATGLTTTAASFCVACPTVYDHRFGDLASPRCADEDRDGFASEGSVCGPVDCDDADASVFPGAGERCNGRDDDCDGATDEEPAASAACTTACTATAVCQAGSCVTTPIICDDTNPCTADACDPGLGCRFTNQPNGLSCADGNVCTGNEVCTDGVCGNAPDLSCNDGNNCTIDSCAPPNGCRNLPISGCCSTNADCADASLCTQNERCVGGQCLSDPVGCDDGNACTNDSCAPATGCANVAVVNGISCGDGNICNGQETCQGGTCTSGAPLSCNDGNACTVDGCSIQSGCTNQATPGCCTTNADCADASACTLNERCVAGSCVSDPLACDDGNPCTADACVPASGCGFTPVPNGQSCSDLDFCDGLETCQAGSCVVSAPPDCNDGNPCTADGCSTSTGCTHAAVASCCFTDGDCVDADACTVNERCVGGACQSDTRNCNDGNACTVDGCDPASGCTNTAVIDGTGCTDGSACDGSEACTAGTCREGDPLVCDDANACTQDSCSNAIGCQHAPVAACCNTDAECADADQCTVGERCTAQHTCTSGPRTCADTNPCTTDACNPATGCTFVPTVGTACNDGDACTRDDACSAGTCGGAPVDCSDGNLCNGAEACVAGVGSCAAAPGPLTCTPGNLRADRTCGAEWHVENPNNLRGTLSTRQSCTEGDPTCDFDADSATCTFRVSICLHVPDARFAPACEPAPVRSYLLQRPSVRRQPASANSFLSALGALSGAAIDTDGRTLRFTPPLAAPECTAYVPVVVGIGSRATVRARTSLATGLFDRDSLRLECN